MSQISMKQLLEAGVHFGHQTRRWNPKMKQYIFGARNGIYIIDLQKTVQLFKVAYEFLVETTEAGHSVLFVGTKKQAQEAIYEESTRAGMYYVNQRWLGGMLTNFQTIKQSIERLKKLEAMKEDDSMSKFPKKEILKMERHMQKLERNLGGIKNMDRLPGAVFVIDPRRENIAVAEARRLNIPVVAVVDTNCDPDDIDYVIPGNDDAIRAIRLMASSVANACLEGNERAKEKAAAAAEEEILVEEAPEDMDVQVSPDTKPYISDLPKEQRNLPQVEPEIIVVKSELVETEADTAPADTDAPVEADAPAEAEVAEPEAAPEPEAVVEESAEESPEE